MTQKKHKKTLAEKKPRRKPIENDAITYSKFKKILDIISRDGEFEKIWAEAPAYIKVSFIKDAFRYVLKEKGKETEGVDAHVLKNSTEYDRMVELAEKLS